ncbi:MAG: hypothetical protein KIG36_02610, partial [Eubacteriales bacterium]|nr:hypothetical protein [Eubacteriales bacterium]
AACRESAAFWDAYLTSCPLVETGDHTCSDGTVLTAAAIRARQLWAWQVALKNINLLEENRFSCFAAPDKPQWFGVWSNDGAETLAALSLTSAAPLARRALIEYADKAVTPDGVQSWYTHSDGVGCYGNPGDTGRFSHGVPCWVHAVDFYIRAADDAAILSETLDSGGTLWERIRVYLDRYMERRDVNGDGLVEWVNLWETGWDDKVGPFFSKSPISEWIRRIPTLEGEQIREFYEAFSCPVTPMVEQVYLLWALDGGAHMADLMGEAETAARYRATADRARRAVSETLWDETDGFYHDADVKAGTLSPTKNADVFYWLYYEPDPLRAGRIVARLLDPAAFGTRCLPMCSLDSEGFRPDGYWCGGHWPREMSYVSLGLARAGRRDLAEDVLLRAICSMPGNRMAEVLDPLTGRQSTAPNNLAYCVLNNVALLDLYGKTRWTDQKGQ